MSTSFPGFDIKEEVFQSTNTIIYRATRTEDNLPVILKTHRDTHPTLRDIARYKHEFEMVNGIDTDAIPQYMGLAKHNNHVALVIKDFGGISLKAYCKEQPVTVKEFLEIGIQLADILGTIHKNNIIHKDINPSNIIIDPWTKAVKLIDFGISSKLSRETQQAVNLNVLEGTLEYISPEQTGRMNHPVDYRTDFYSLGVTFYELLARQLPFQASDPMELVHCHLAKSPTPLPDLNADLPKVIGDIIFKLLSKTVEDRYQSALGLKKDLEKCLTALEEKGTIDAFTPGQQDFSDKFKIPQKLYGRDEEIKTLIDTFWEVFEGEQAMVMVSGYSGIGKSALVNEIHKPIVNVNGNFISGKFDQLRKDKPYNAFIQAFREMMRQFLTESEEVVATRKAGLLHHLGSNGQIIIDIIPELEMVIGPQPAVQELPAEESQNRFILVFKNFVKALARKENPLTIFLDDLQWADLASLNLIQLLVTDLDIRYLYFIGAYRDNEVSATHPLMHLMEQIQKKQPLREIKLTPLQPEFVTAIIRDTLHCSSEAAKPLSDMAFDRTNGNPFFLNQLLQNLYDEQLIRFDSKHGTWVWDTQQIKGIGFSDNVVDLMIGKVEKLDEQSRNILQLAACLGNRFDLKYLAVITGKSARSTAADLWAVIDQGLIVPLDDHYKYVLSGTEHANGEEQEDETLTNARYKFQHDRLQQAAYAIIPFDVKQSTHLKLGRLILANTPEEDLADHVFDIVNHLNLGLPLVKDKDEKLRFAELNKLAGKKAKASAAYDSAMNYFKAGVQLMESFEWHAHYQLKFDLALFYGESEYLAGQYDSSKDSLNALLQKAANRLDKLTIYEILVLLHTKCDDKFEAVEAGRKALKPYGISLPYKDNAIMAGMMVEVMKAKVRLLGKSPESVLNKPLIKDEEKGRVLDMLITLGPPAFQTNQKLFALIILKNLNLSLKHGHTDASAIGYMGYGMILINGFQDFDNAYRFGKVAIALNNKIPNNLAKWRLAFLYANFVAHWKEDLRHNLDYFLEIQAGAMECGDPVYAGYAFDARYWWKVDRGFNLNEIRLEGEKFREFFQKTNDIDGMGMLMGRHQLVLALQGMTNQPWSMETEDYQLEQVLPTLIEKGALSTACLVYVSQIQLAYLFEQYDLLWDLLEASQPYIEYSAATSIYATLHFFHALAGIAIMDKVTPSRQKKLKRMIKSNLKKLKKWGNNSPMNYQNLYLIAKAEADRMDGDGTSAMAGYQTAIKMTGEHGFNNNQALCYELSAKYLLANGEEELGMQHLSESRYLYEQWGATAKVQFLDEKYPSIQPLQNTPKTGGTLDATLTSTATTSGTGSALLDLSTVLKSATAISGEIKLDRLLDKLMRIVIENAGAEKGVLVLNRDNMLRIDAEGSVEEVQVLQSLPVKDSGKLSEAILQYAARTKENIVLDDATSDERFEKDAYIGKYRPKSILCAPIINQGELIGLIYLENNLTTGAFTQDRLEVLKMLSGQVAVSIDNALLYDNLEQKVVERTEEIRHQKEIIEEKNKDILDSINYAKRIQEAVLPPENQAQGFFGESFVLYKPKDIVSGDFYWMEDFDDILLFAAVDCTGHGVPGAFMTMLGNALLNQAIREQGHRQPAQILNSLSEGIRNTLRSNQGDRMVRDGMDLALCAFDRKENRLSYAGAFNSLVCVIDGELRETKADKFPIGAVIKGKTHEYAHHEMTLKKGDCVYIYTDGYSDQFGGPKGRKYMSRNFKQLLVTLNDKSMPDQKDALELTLARWMGEEHKQLDDILVMGFRV